MAGILSKGITLSYKEDGTFKALSNLQEIPNLGGTSESVEVTTLADPAHMYIEGLISYGDSLGFKFLYDGAQFTELNGLKGEAKEWQVKLPDGSTCVFSAEGSVALDGVGVNAPLTYTLSLKVNSEMVWGSAQ